MSMTRLQELFDIETELDHLLVQADNRKQLASDAVAIHHKLVMFKEQGESAGTLTVEQKEELKRISKRLLQSCFGVI